jgi:hypothetical protein
VRFNNEIIKISKKKKNTKRQLRGKKINYIIKRLRSDFKLKKIKTKVDETNYFNMFREKEEIDRL